MFILNHLCLMVCITATYRNSSMSVANSYARKFHFICIVESFQKLLELEAIYITPSQYTSTISELVDYHKQVYT